MYCIHSNGHGIKHLVQLYTILLFVLLTVFIGGLMVGRTPEYLGKKVQAREVKLAALGILVMPLTVLVLTGIAVALPAGRAGAEPVKHFETRSYDAF